MVRCNYRRGCMSGNRLFSKTMCSLCLMYWLLSKNDLGSLALVSAFHGFRPTAPNGDSSISFSEFVQTLNFASNTRSSSKTTRRSARHTAQQHFGSNNTKSNNRNGTAFSEHDAEFLDFATVRDTTAQPQYFQQQQTMQNAAAARATRTVLGPKVTAAPLDYPEWRQLMEGLFDACSGGLMSSLHIGKDSADAGVLLSQVRSAR